MELLASGGFADARVFRRIFDDEFPDVEFVSMGGVNEVEKDGKLIATVLEQVLDGIEIFRVIDRDDQSATQVEERKRAGFRVLSRRHLESYLFDEEVLQLLCASVNKPEKWPEIAAKKRELLAASRAQGHAHDDMKVIGQSLRVAIGGILGLTRQGTTTEAFCLDTLAPLVKKGTKVHSELRSAIFGEPSVL